MGATGKIITTAIEGGALGEYDGNNYYGSVIHTRVSLCLPEATAKINIGDDNNDNKNNYHHHINRVFVVGYSAVVSITPTRPQRRLHRQRGIIRHGPGGAATKMTMLGSVLEYVKNSKYTSPSWTRGNNLLRRIPKTSMTFPCTTYTWRIYLVGRRRRGWGRWIVWADCGSILRLVQEEEGYDTTGSFQDALDDDKKVMTG